MAETKETEITELTCIICSEVFTEPKVLPCCHSFCKRCLEGILDKAQEKEKLACPQCRAEHQVPPSGPEGFLTDYTLSEANKNSTFEPKTICEQCDKQDTAVSYCYECSAYLCDTCTDTHKNVKFLKSHQIDSLPFHTDHLPVDVPKPIHCPQHPDRVFELYCKNCQCVVCILCIVSSHNGHTLGNIGSETRKGVEGQIKDLTTKAESKLATFEASLEYINIVERKTTKEPVQLKAEIHSLFDSLITSIEARRVSLIGETEESAKKDLEELVKQRELVETTIAGFKGSLSLANRSLQCSNDTEVLLLGTQVMARLRELNTKYWDGSITEAIDMTTRKFHFKSPTCLGTIQNVKTLAAMEARLTLILPSSALLGKQVIIEVQPGTPTMGRIGLQMPPLEVKVLHGEARVEIPYPPTGTPNPNKQTWSVMFTPVVSGPHVIQVKVKLKIGIENVDRRKESTINIAGTPSVGAKIERGPDWHKTYGPQDGGKGNQGVVSALSNSSEGGKAVHVWWESNGQMNNYRWGTDNIYEIQFVL